MSTKKDISSFQSSSEFDVFEGEGSGLRDAGSSASGVPWNLPDEFNVTKALTGAKQETLTLTDNLSKVTDLSGFFLALNGVDPQSDILHRVPPVTENGKPESTLRNPMNRRMAFDAYDGGRYISSIDITGTRLSDRTGVKDKAMGYELGCDMKSWHDKLWGSAVEAIEKAYGAKFTYSSKRESKQRWDNLCNRLTAPSDEECTDWIASHNSEKPKDSRPTLKYVYPSNGSVVEDPADFILGSIQKLLQGPERITTWHQRPDDQPPAYEDTPVPTTSTAASNALAPPGPSARPSSAAGSAHSDAGDDPDGRPRKRRSFVDRFNCFGSAE